MSIKELLQDIENLFKHHPSTPEHQQAKANLEAAKPDLTPEEQEQLDQTIATAAASHAQEAQPAAQTEQPA